jgi:hypothetical protein
MPDLAAYLRTSSDRLQRETWPDPNRLAQELYAILRATPSPTAGALGVDLGEVQFSTSDAPDIALPLIDFDALTPDGVLADQETELKGDDNQQKDQTRLFKRRTVLIGRVQSRSNVGDYTCKIYPNGPSGDYQVESGVLEVQGRDVADDTWVLIARIDTCRLVQTSLTDGDSITQQRIELVQRLHYFAEGNSPRPYAPWGSGAGLDEAPALPHILSLAVQTVQDGIDGTQNASSFFITVNPLLWLPDSVSRTYNNIQVSVVGSTGLTIGTVTLAFDKTAGTITMSFSGGTPSGYSTSQNALTWANSSAIGTITPAGVGVMSYPTNAWNTATIYTTTGSGWTILHSDVTSKWANLGGSPNVYSRIMLIFG